MPETEDLFGSLLDGAYGSDLGRIEEEERLAKAEYERLVAEHRAEMERLEAQREAARAKEAARRDVERRLAAHRSTVDTARRSVEDLVRGAAVLVADVAGALGRCRDAVEDVRSFPGFENLRTLVVLEQMGAGDATEILGAAIVGRSDDERFVSALARAVLVAADGVEPTAPPRDVPPVPTGADGVDAASTPAETPGSPLPVVGGPDERLGEHGFWHLTQGSKTNTLRYAFNGHWVEPKSRGTALTAYTIAVEHGGRPGDPEGIKGYSGKNKWVQDLIRTLCDRIAAGLPVSDTFPEKVAPGMPIVTGDRVEFTRPPARPGPDPEAGATGAGDGTGTDDGSVRADGPAEGEPEGHPAPDDTQEDASDDVTGSDVQAPPPGAPEEDVWGIDDGPDDADDGLFGALPERTETVAPVTSEEGSPSVSESLASAPPSSPGEGVTVDGEVATPPGRDAKTKPAPGPDRSSGKDGDTVFGAEPPPKRPAKIPRAPPPAAPGLIGTDGRKAAVATPPAAAPPSTAAPVGRPAESLGPEERGIATDEDVARFADGTSAQADAIRMLRDVPHEDLDGLKGLLDDWASRPTHTG